MSPWTKKLVQERHVNIVAGRATFADRTPRLYAYVHKQVPSAAARLDQFLSASGVGPNEPGAAPTPGGTSGAASAIRSATARALHNAGRAFLTRRAASRRRHSASRRPRGLLSRS